MRLAIRDNLERQSRPGHQRKRDVIANENETQSIELRGIQKDNTRQNKGYLNNGDL